MARRSASNERYGKYTAPSGKTRKSAAAAKPKRAVADGPAPAKSGSSAKSGDKKTPMMYHPDTPEYRTWRRIWWGFLIGGLVLTTVSFFLMPPRGDQQQLGVILLGAAYAAIAAALYIDFTKMRKLRAAWIASGQAAEAGKAAQKERELKAAQKAAAKEAKPADSTDSDNDTTS